MKEGLLNLINLTNLESKISCALLSPISFQIFDKWYNYFMSHIDS